MKEQIKIRNGVLKKFNVDTTKKILKIGYTLSDGNYNEAVIVRENDDNIAVKNNEAILKFINIYLAQNNITIDQLINNPNFVKITEENRELFNSLMKEIKENRMIYDKSTQLRTGGIIGTSISSIASIIFMITSCMNFSAIENFFKRTPKVEIPDYIPQEYRELYYNAAMKILNDHDFSPLMAAGVIALVALGLCAGVILSSDELSHGNDLREKSENKTREIKTLINSLFSNPSLDERTHLSK